MSEKVIQKKVIAKVVNPGVSEAYSVSKDTVVKGPFLASVGCLSSRILEVALSL